MIYCTYLANVKNLPDTGRKILVTRWKPNNMLDPEKYNLEWWPELAPSELLLSQYKDGSIHFESFKVKFMLEMDSRPDLKQALKNLDDILKSGEDVYLICYEKDYMQCHRTMIRYRLEVLGGHKGEELKS